MDYLGTCGYACFSLLSFSVIKGKSVKAIAVEIAETTFEDRKIISDEFQDGLLCLFFPHCSYTFIPLVEQNEREVKFYVTFINMTCVNCCKPPLLNRQEC